MTSLAARRTLLVAALVTGTVGIGGAALAANGHGSRSNTAAGSVVTLPQQPGMDGMPMQPDDSTPPTAAGSTVTGTTASATGPRHLRAQLRDVQGTVIGIVDLQRLASGANQVSVQAWNLTPGFHGFHLHSVGTCNPNGAKPFASAGGHFNPTGKPEGMQAGAFPVLLAGPDGRAQTKFVDGNFRLADLFTATGTAVVVHAGPDNYANIPARYVANGVQGPDAETMATGDAGGRIACGVLVPNRMPAAASPTPGATMGMPGMPGMPAASSPAVSPRPHVTHMN